MISSTARRSAPLCAPPEERYEPVLGGLDSVDVLKVEVEWFRQKVSHESEYQERGGALIGAGARTAHRREHDGEAMGLADRLAAIDKDCAARLKEPFRSADHGELLYDERGLPR